MIWPEYEETNDKYRRINEFIDENSDLFETFDVIDDLLKRYI